MVDRVVNGLPAPCPSTCEDGPRPMKAAFAAKHRAGHGRDEGKRAKEHEKHHGRHKGRRKHRKAKHHHTLAKPHGTVGVALPVAPVSPPAPSPAPAPSVGSPP